MVKKEKNSNIISKSDSIESPGSLRERSAASVSQTGVTDEERRQLIAKAAYFRAEQRGFNPGSDLDDWLEAETEIDAILGKSSADSRPEGS